MDKVILVTGGSSGIGKSICTILSSKGYRVFGTSRNPKNIKEKLTFELIEMDVQNEVSVKIGIEEVIRKAGKIDVLVNNAGVGIMGAIEDCRDTDFQEIFDINVFGLLRTMHYTLPYMRMQKCGLVINISSIAGHMGLPYRGIYSASKAAVHKITEALRIEVAPFGIHACIVDPGDFSTNISQNRRVVNAVSSQSVYTSETLRIEKMINDEIQHSSNPDIIGHLVHKIILSTRPKVYYPIGKPLQKLALLVKRLLGSNIFEGILKKNYGIK